MTPLFYGTSLYGPSQMISEMNRNRSVTRGGTTVIARMARFAPDEAISSFMASERSKGMSGAKAPDFPPTSLRTCEKIGGIVLT